MATVSTTFTTFASLTRSGSTGIGWSNPSNAQSSDNTYASLDATATTGYTNYLKATGLADAIPAGATITGITITIERQDAQTSTHDSVVQIVRGGTITGGNKADTTTAWPLSDGSATYGGSSDVWGLSGGISVSEINASDFGVVISVSTTDGYLSSGGL